MDGPGYPAAVQPALTPQHLQEGHAVKGKPAEEEGQDHSGYCPQYPLQPTPLQSSACTGAGAHTRGRGSLWFTAAFTGYKGGHFEGMMML